MCVHGFVYLSISSSHFRMVFVYTQVQCIAKYQLIMQNAPVEPLFKQDAYRIAGGGCEIAISYFFEVEVQAALWLRISWWSSPNHYILLYNVLYHTYAPCPHFSPPPIFCT